MNRVIASATLGKEKGYAALDKDELGALLWADQLEFMFDLLTTPEERREAQAEKERKRQATEEAALQRYKKEREEYKKREAARQRQMEIEADDKKAKKLLRAALLLDARGGFDKQVRQQLQDIIDKYPDTPTAQRAKRQLDKMAK